MAMSFKSKPLSNVENQINPLTQPPPCKYRTGRNLGSGTYAIVKAKIKIETNEAFAAKVLNKALLRGREKMIHNELNVLSKVSRGHPNIVSLIDYFETSNNLMELASGGELFDRIWSNGGFYEKQAANLLRTVVDAVSYLHRLDIVHRDLKPENLIFKSKEPDSPLLVADFGLSKVLDPDQFYSLTTTCGTPGYMAPEIYMKSGYGKPVDMWAIGVITYFLLAGVPPFYSNDPNLQLESIINARYEFKPELWNHISYQAKHFVQSLLVINPKNRMTAEQALSHPWLTISSPAPVANGIPQEPKLLPYDESESIATENTRPRRSFRSAINMVRAVNVLSRIAQFPIEEDVGKSGVNGGNLG